MNRLLGMRNLTPLEASSLKMVFLLLIFGIGACMRMAGQEAIIREQQSHIESLKDELVNAEALSAVK